jgi:hypothetical protein
MRETDAMLFLSIASSLPLLLFANLAIWRPQRCPAWPFGVAFIVCGIVCTICPMSLFFLPPVALEFLLLGTAMIACAALRIRPWYIVPVSGLVTLIAFGIPTWFALEGQREYSRLREKYPYESMEQRLSAPRSASRIEPLPEPAAVHLKVLEEWIGRQQSSYRARQLMQLHEHTVLLFVDSPGFGVSRMSVPTESDLMMGVRNDPPIPQPGARSQPGASPGDLEREAHIPDDVRLYLMHESSVSDFVYAGGFGFFKDRGHVAGFESHRFSSTPEPDEPWKLQNVDLVGLLMHDEPVVYISSHLPRMDELREAPTRKLDTFESVGLPGLRRGDDLFVRETAGRLRMLGAIRATKQCTSCHDCERGDLLGAFSYTLRLEGR